MEKYFCFLFTLIFLPFPSNLAFTNNVSSLEQKLLHVDREFAKTAKEKGIDEAYLLFLAKEGIILPVNGHPIVGLKELKKTLPPVKKSIKKYTLIWDPIVATISNAGDLAYTYGHFALTEVKSNIKKKGYYGSVWKRNKEGNWKLAFSHGLFFLKILNKSPGFKKKKNLDKNSKDLVETELAFSKYSIEKGISEAFYHFIAENGVVISPTGPPSTKETFFKQISKKQESKWKTKLEWYPVMTYVSASNDLGYNSGPYNYIVIDPAGIKKEYKGYFFTTWKKEAGSWKFIFDGGNQISKDK